MPITVSIALAQTAALTQELRSGADYYRRGIAFYHAQNYEGAIADFSAAIKLIAHLAPQRRSRSSHIFAWDKEAEKADRAESAEITAVDPQAAIILTARGLARVQINELDAAIGDFDQAIRISPRLFEAYFSRGEARFKLKDYGGAIADYDRALRIDPGSAEAFNNRGNARYHIGEVRGALADFDRAIRLDPRVTAFHYNRGKARREAGDFTGALSDYDQGIKMEVRPAWGYYGRGTVYSDQGKYHEAIANYDRALELNPRFALPYCNRGLMRLRLGGDNKSKDDIRQCLLLDPELRGDLELRIKAITQGRLNTQR